MLFPVLKLNCFQGRPRLKKAIADAYSHSFGRTLNPETEVTITTGANEGTLYGTSVVFRNSIDRPPILLGMLSAFMGFIEPGDEVIIFEPFFDQ